jgi:hypothetical protein
MVKADAKNAVTPAIISVRVVDSFARIWKNLSRRVCFGGFPGVVNTELFETFSVLRVVVTVGAFFDVVIADTP